MEDESRESTNRILGQILNVLSSIDGKLQIQEEHLQSLNTLVRAGHSNESSPPPHTPSENAASSSERPMIEAMSGTEASPEVPNVEAGDREKALHLDPGRKTEERYAIKPVSRVSTFSKKILYTERCNAVNSSKKIDFLGQSVDLEFFLGAVGILPGIQENLGDWWQIPDDGRVRLTFSKEGYQKRYESSQSPFIERPNLFYALDRMKGARQFDELLRCHSGNDFFAVDFDDTHNTRIYRLGQKAVGPPLTVDADTGTHDSPWSRLVVYQGATTGGSIKQGKNQIEYNSVVPIPYFSKGGSTSLFWSHLFSHLQLRPRKTTHNPYLDETIGFHTVFFEIQKYKQQHTELWKHGPLYDDPLDRTFRKCAYTIYSVSDRRKPLQPYPEEEEAPKEKTHLPSRHWTIVLLTPSLFFDENNTSFPTRLLMRGTQQTLGHCMGRLTKVGAELNLIAQGLTRISDRWLDFQVFFDHILDSGDSLMRPAEHDNLLFDDGSFSRSRKYFWAINCLSTFEEHISDNIEQWELFIVARVAPLIQAGLLPELDIHQYNTGQKQHAILVNQREWFRTKLANTKALRDALFSASAVIESRASTRLGENVKLLTFVSIFFLPLSFCASLWSVNDMFSTKALIVTICLVGGFTYLVVLNINTLVRTSSSVYERRKRPIINAMKAEQGEDWKTRGRRFEVFRPRHERLRPSEWLVLWYLVMRPDNLLAWSCRIDWQWPIRSWKRMQGSEKEATISREEAWVL
ncbi:hypothetical protein MMC25_003924 [Agyrium rufum]|nr:hypothetical protein [Agyrium rufum]